MEHISLVSFGLHDGPVVRLRCPYCRHVGTFDSVGKGVQVNRTSREFLGVRRCPNTACAAAIFVVASPTGELLSSFPPELLDFDSSSVPTEIVSSLEEALQCHAVGCYRAAAIMVRRTLEDVCADRGASGSNLKERLSALGRSVVLPSELLDGLDALRLLGNDAAHVEAQTFDNIERKEVELAIDVTKEVLKAVFQYAELVGRLQALKKTQDGA